MKNNKLEGYNFVDCLLVDFKVDKLLSTMFVIVETYYPILKDGTQIKGLLKLVFNEIRQLSMIKGDEFDFDIQLKYDDRGNDFKANEVYSIEIFEMDDNIITCELESDMLKFSVQCSKLDIMKHS